SDTEPGGEVGAVRGAVDDRLVHRSVVQHGRDVLDRLVDGQRVLGQIGAPVVMAGHPDAAVLDHDHVQAAGHGTSPEPAIERHRGGTGTTGDDDQRMGRLSPGPDVVEVELVLT